MLSFCKICSILTIFQRKKNRRNQVFYKKLANQKKKNKILLSDTNYNREKKTFMKINNKGFTLVELLVVVLIIGILAAIAVPQYQKAVLKSRASQMMALVRSMANAQETYYLANGEYANGFNKLDLVLPSTELCNSTADTCRIIDNWEFAMYCPSGPCESIEAAYFGPSTNVYMFKIAHYLMNARDGYEVRENSGNLICIATADSTQIAQAQKVCKALGGTVIENSNDRYFKL